MYPCCGVFRCAPGEDDLSILTDDYFFMETSVYFVFIEGTLTNDNWDITIDIPVSYRISMAMYPRYFREYLRMGQNHSKPISTLRVEGMNIQRYTHATLV